MMSAAKNQLEVAFLGAAEDPRNIAAFEKELLEAELVVPCQALGAGSKAGQGRLQLPPGVEIPLKAYRQASQWIVPFFSDLQRFEVWSAPDPEGAYICIRGKVFFAMVPKAAAALMNPGSEHASKWFTPEEIAEIVRGIKLDFKV